MSYKIFIIGFLDSPVLSSPPYKAGMGGININSKWEYINFVLYKPWELLKNP